MYDLIYDEGRAVAYIKLGEVYTLETNIKVATVSEGKIFSFTGQIVGHLHKGTSSSPEQALSSAFRKLLEVGVQPKER